MATSLPNWSASRKQQPFALSDNSRMENGLRNQLLAERQLTLTRVWLALLALSCTLLFLWYEIDYARPAEAERFKLCVLGLHGVNGVFWGGMVWEGLGRGGWRWGWLARWGVFMVVHPGPWFEGVGWSFHWKDGDNSGDYEIPINYLLCLAAMLKNIMLFFPATLSCSIYLQPRSRRICTIYDLRHRFLFAVKCLFRDAPLRLLGFSTLVAWLYFSLALRVAERCVPVADSPFDYFENCLWFAAVTMTSVGFGDLALRGQFGEVLACLCILWGSLAISASLVVLVNTLGLTPKEAESLLVLRRVELGVERKSVSARYIRLALWRVWRNYSQQTNHPQTSQQRRLRMLSKSLRRTSPSPSYPLTNLLGEMQRNFDHVGISSQYLLQNNSNLLNFISREFFLDSRTDILFPEERQWAKEDSIGEVELDYSESVGVRKRQREAVREVIVEEVYEDGEEEGEGLGSDNEGRGLGSDLGVVEIGQDFS